MREGKRFSLHKAAIYNLLKWYYLFLLADGKGGQAARSNQPGLTPARRGAPLSHGFAA
jgi:hypothetical protein